MMHSMTLKDVPATFIGDAFVEQPVSTEWKAIYYDYDYIAAEQRLQLARRYQQEYVKLDSRFDNLRFSQSWLTSQKSLESAQLLIDYVTILAPYLRQRGLRAELLRWCEDGLNACHLLRQNAGFLLLLRGEIQLTLGLWNEAQESVQQAIALSEADFPDIYAHALMVIGEILFNRGEYTIALATLEKAASLPSNHQTQERLATYHSEKAAYHLNRGEFDTALSLYLEADRLQKRGETQESSHHTLLMLGVTYRKKKEYEPSVHYLQRLIEQGELHKDQETTATACHHLAWTYLEIGNTQEARHLCGRAIALYERIGNARGLSDAYEQLGCLSLAEEHALASIPHFKQSLVMRLELKNMHGAASSLRRLAVAYLALGKYITALKYLWRSLSLYYQLGMLSRQRVLDINRQLFQAFVKRLKR